MEEKGGGINGIAYMRASEKEKVVDECRKGTETMMKKCHV